MPMFLRLGLASLFAIFVSGVAVAQQVTVANDATMYSEPRADSSVVTKLAKGTQVQAVGKQSGWLNVKTAKESGWISSFNVRFGEGGPAGSGGADAGRLFSGSKPQITATIGVRGLDAEDLKHASFDAQELDRLDSYSATKEDGEQVAQAKGLVALKLDYLK